MNIQKLFFCCVCLLIKVSASSPFWNIDENVIRYFKNSELQRQWAISFISNLEFNPNDSVLDFGCGDGRVSSHLSFLVPQGRVDGVDSSQAMIDFAKRKFLNRAYPNLFLKKLTF